jgi:flagellar protein FlaI
VDVECRNLREIERLNQRGGRSLSIVDLVADGTLTAEMAAFCWQAVHGGVSYLTGAVPGGAGKTTLMAGLLGFLPPGERVVTVGDRSAIDSALAGDLSQPATLLAHEIGRGHWFGYIWGPEAVDFFSLAGSGVRAVTCLHADDAEQAWGILGPLGVARESFESVPLQLFIVVDRRGGRVLRRVRWVYFRVQGLLRPVYAWSRESDEFERLTSRDDLCQAMAEAAGSSPDEQEARWREREAILEDMLREGVFAYEDVRRRILEAAIR